MGPIILGALIPKSECSNCLCSTINQCNDFCKLCFLCINFSFINFSFVIPYTSTVNNVVLPYKNVVKINVCMIDRIYTYSHIRLGFYAAEMIK